MATFNTDISDIWWMRPEKSDLSKIAGGAFAQSYNAALDRQQQQEQFGETMLLKQQALQNERDKNTIDQLGLLTKQDLENKKAMGYTALGQVVARAGEYPEGWNDPAYQKEFWDTASKWPETMKDPGFKSITDNFDLSLRAKFNSDLATQRDAARRELEDAKIKSREEIEAERNRIRELELEHDIRDRYGDMGYRAFMTELSIIKDDKLTSPTKKRMEARRLYDQAEQGLYRPNIKTDSGSPPSAPTPPQAPTAPKAAPAQASATKATGPTATNPKTGEKVQFIDGKWQPIQ